MFVKCEINACDRNVIGTHVFLLSNNRSGKNDKIRNAFCSRRKGTVPVLSSCLLLADSEYEGVRYSTLRYTFRVSC